MKKDNREANRSGIRNDDIPRDIFEEERDSEEEQCGFEINHTVYWITSFDGKVVDENL